MLHFVITRLLMVVPTFVGVTLAAFAFIRLIPGDPIELLVGERGLDPARHARLLHEMGFDRPLWEQYFGFLGEILNGNLGKSIVTKQPVLEEFLTLFPATIELSVCALTVALLIGLPAGIFAAVRRGTAFDHSSSPCKVVSCLCRI